MSVIISDQSTSIQFLFSNGEKVILDKEDLNLKKQGREVFITNGDGFIDGSYNKVIKLHYSEVTSPVLASNDELITLLLGYQETAFLGKVTLTDGTTDVSVEPNGSLPVTLQDQHTPVVITPFSILEQSTTTTGAVAIGDYVIPVTSVTGMTAGINLSSHKCCFT
jgi:hypothetical protein